MRELKQTELQEVNGGVDWTTIGAGIGIVSLSIVIVGTAGMATIPISLLGAATVGELIVAITAIASSGTGGFIIGHGAMSS